MKKMGIEGKYLGETYKEGDDYYSLFGQIKDLKTMEGKLYERIYQTYLCFNITKVRYCNFSIPHIK